MQKVQVHGHGCKKSAIQWESLIIKQLVGWITCLSDVFFGSNTAETLTAQLNLCLGPLSQVFHSEWGVTLGKNGTGELSKPSIVDAPNKIRLPHLDAI